MASDADLLSLSHDEMSVQARTFLESPLGAYIVEATSQDIEIARDALENITPWGVLGRRKWREARMQLDVARRVQGYFAELIQTTKEDIDANWEAAQRDSQETLD